MNAAVAIALLPALAWWSGPVAANPRGGSVVQGNATIQSGTGGVLNINQTSTNAIIDWEAFSIQAGELTRFRQPGTNSAVLNRVTGGDPSEIHGALQANGSVFVINPNGILVGAGGTIDVHGLVLSTLDINNGEFLARGDMVFKGSGNTGVTNLGRINAIGGDVFLIGKTVTNSGSIHAPKGTVGLAAGEEVLLHASSGAEGGRIFVRATGSGVSGPGILNDGTIEGAAVELKAHGNHYALAINNKGSIRATGAVHSGGRVHLQGIGGSVANSGSIRATSSGGGDASILIEAAYAKVDGELRAESLAAGAASVKIAASEVAEVGATIRAHSVESIGGTVDVEAARITVNSDTLIDASGILGGGSVRIGGGFQGSDPDFSNARSVEMAAGATIRADARHSGDGGTVVLWSDGDTTFRGDITAEGRGDGRGGLVEVSGREGLLVDGTVSTLAESGANGLLLLDPKNLTISSAASSTTNINTGTLQTLVAANHVVVSTLDPGATDAGHISVLNPVRYTSDNSLTLLAEGDLYIGDDIINRGAGNVNLVAGWDSSILSLADLFAGTATSHATLPGTSTATGDIDMDTSFFAIPGAFGNNGGSVYVGSLGAPDIAADRSVAVGSRTGQTNVAGHDVMVWGSAFTGGINAGAQRYSQIGYNLRDAGTAITDPATGRIRVAALNDVEVVANKYEVGIRGSSGWTSSTDNTGNASFAQIGHGGERESVRGISLSGEIIVEAGRDVSLLGGLAYNNHATIGHGGFDNASTFTATLGGDISVDAGRHVSLKAGYGYHAHVQIGHGVAHQTLVDFSRSNIAVTAGGDVTVRGGQGVAAAENNSRAQAQIGHGAYNSDFVAADQTLLSLVAGGKGFLGNILVDSGGFVLVEAGKHDANNLAFIGHGGLLSDGVHSGTITVLAQTGVELKAGEGADVLFARIGHLTQGASASYLSGEIEVVTAGGDIKLQSGTSANLYTQIGHGGVSSLTTSAILGDSHIRVSATTGDILLYAGTANNTWAKIGHGNNGLKLARFDENSVEVTAGRHIRLVASQFDSYTSVTSSNAQIGHGGVAATVRGADETIFGYSGDIDITAGGKIDLLAGRNAATYNWALVGHTSYNSSNSQGIHSGNISVTAGTAAGLDLQDYGVTIQAASGDYNGATNTNTSYYSFAAIGHRGHSAGTTLSGDILLDVIRGGVTLQGGNGQPGSTAAGTPADLRLHGASIGHGGYSLNSGLSGDVRVYALGDILLRAGTGPASPVLIGHGGRTSSGVISGDIEVISREGNLELDATLASNVVLYSADSESLGAVYIGHGPSVTGSGTRQGDILVDVAGEISLVGEARPPWIGHRTTTSGGISNADLTIRARSVDRLSGDSGNGLFHVDSALGATMGSQLAAGHVSLIATGSEGLWLAADIRQNSSFALNLLSLSDLYLTAHAINQGSGAVNLVAGWDPSVSSLSGGAPTVPGAGGIPRQYQVRDIDMDTEIFGVAGSYGANGGSVWIGADPTLTGADRAVMVASRTGQTNVAGSSIHVWGGAVTGGPSLGERRFSQIGYNRREGATAATLAATGRIRVGAINDIEVISNKYEVGLLGSGGWPGNDHSGFASYAQIGHGGDRDAVANMELTGEIIVEAGRDLTGLGGKTRENFVLIGHGGYDNATSTSAKLGGAILVAVGNNLSMSGGQGIHSFAQIGHGGARHPVLDFVASDITVTAGGDITFTGGAGGAGGSSNGAHARIGHGGYDSPVQASGSGYVGDIHVIADGNLAFLSGGGGATYNYVQIGHGGVRSAGDHSGDICVVAGTGAVISAGATSGSYGYAQIGHGGELTPGNHSGDVTVVAPDGSISLVGGNGTGRYAQIGHGGTHSGGDLGGEITVVADHGGDLSLAGGNSASSYAMIGHGDGAGATTGGSREGGMRLFAGGTLSATNGAGLFNTNILHQSNGGLVAGDYLGGNGFQLWANGGIALPDSTLNGLNTMVNGNLASGPISLALANDIDLTIDGPDISLDNADNFHLLIGGNLTMLSSYEQAGTGSVTLVAGWDGVGAIFSNGSVSYTGGDFCAPVIEEGSPSGFNTVGCDWFGNDAAGNGVGVLTIGSATQTEAVRIGTRLGDLVAAGHAVNLYGGSGANAATQLGFHPGAVNQGADGDLNLHVKSGGLLLQGGGGTGSYAQIGHGGLGSTFGNHHLGDITISFCEAGDVSILGGGIQSYAQIGHGGLDLNSTQRGEIFIGGSGSGGQAGEILLQSGAANYSYTQIGHGGGNISGSPYRGGDASGSIWIDSADKVTVSASGYGAYSQIGMGGLVNTNGAYGLAGDRIVVIAENGIDVSGGTAAWSYGQIGHGGYQSGGGSKAHQGDIYLNYNPDAGVASGGGEITVSGRKGTSTGALGATYAQIGHGGRNAAGIKRGDIIIGQSDAITLTGFGGESYAQIGHGGNGTGPNYAASGSITLNTSGLLQMNSGFGAEAYTLVGHGGYTSTATGTTANYGLAGESIAVHARAVEMMAGSALGAFSQIGHGGYRISGLKTADIFVTTLDGISLDARSGKGEAAYVQIGHGGYEAGGTVTGHVSVLATSATSAITLQSGDNLYQHAQIGHGGRTSSGTKTGDITVAAGSGGIHILGGGDSTDTIISIDSFAQIGHGGSGSSGTVTGDLSVSTSDGGDIIIRGGADRYTHAQIGHGGRASNGTQNGAVEVTSDGAISLIASYDEDKPGGTSNGAAGETYAQIGHGGMYGGGLKSGAIEVNAKTGILLRNGEANYGFTRIGHGGYDPGSVNNPATVIVDADIRVATESGDIVLDAYQTQAYDWNLVQIGHGGIYKGTTRAGAYRGDIVVDAGTGGVSVLAGRGHASAAQIGHGGIGISGNHSGAIHVSGDGDLVMRTQAGGTGADDRRYARIGHGGASDVPAITMSGDLSGDICVTLGGSVLLDASVAQADASAVQIGHGGSAVKGNFDGKIVVVARGAGGISLAGGPGVGTYAQIGHGGTDTDGTMTGHLHVIAETGDLSLAGGSGASAYAMFGHGDGARSSLGQRGGGVHLFAQGNLTGTGGSGAADEGNVFFFHQNSSGLQPGDYLGGDGYQKVVNGSISLPAYASVDESTIINGNIGEEIYIVDHSNTDYSFDSGDVFVNTSNDFYIVTGGNITVLNSYQNAGSGNITLVAGWNGVSTTTPGNVTYNNGELCDPIISNPGLGIDFNDCESFGNDGKGVILGSVTQTAPVLVGSRVGTTTVAGHGLALHGGNGTDGAATQLGFRPDGSGAVSGAINIFLKGGGLELQAGSATDAYVQIGHGGTGATSAAVNASIAISFCEAGDVALTAGNGVGAYAHIGHGGNAWNGDRTGDIRLEGLGELSLTSGNTNAYTQIGHGGAAVETVYGAGSGTGSVFIEAGGDVFLTGGGGANSYSQIGHGGGRQGGHFEGSVTLLSGGSVEAHGGGGDTSSTQIGHGGRNASLSSIGPGDILVEAAEDILLFSGTRDYSGSKIGHGNHNQKLSSFAESSVEVTAGRHIRLVSPQFEIFTNTQYASTQIGHGGYSAIVGTVPSTQGYSGDLNVTAGGKLDLIAGKNGRSYLWSLIGHTSYFNSSGQHSGNITVTTGTVAGLDDYGVTVRGPSSDFAGANASSYYSFAAIGHRGHSNSTGTYSTGLSGDILVDVIRGGVTLESGNGLVTPDIRLHGAQIGHGGYAAGHLTYGLHGSVRVHAQDDILLRAGTSRYAAVVIGHGGSSSFGPMGGADEVIEVISREGSLELDSTLASTTGGGVFIGHGSSNSTSGTRQGDILVDVAGEISLVGNLSTIGHRTSTSGGISNSDLTIRARSMDTVSGDSGGGLLRLPASLGASLSAHLNAGHLSIIGTGSQGIEMGARLTANSAFDLNLLSHSNLSILADLVNQGDGGIHLIAGWDPSAAPFHPAGETLPPSAGSPDYREYWIRSIDANSALLAAANAYGNADSVLTIGSATQTGTVRVGTRLGDLVAAGHAVHLFGGSGANAATQIGYHPGATNQGANGDLNLHVKSGGLLLEGGGGQYSYAQIGHGGNGSTDGNNHLGDISIHFSEQGDLSLNGGSSYAYAQIGHGGLSLNATHSGAIDIVGNGTTRAGDVSLNSGASYAYTQIGHGGGNVGSTTYKGGDANGSIWIDAAGKVTVSAAGQGAYSQIGMGGLVNTNANYGLAGDRTVVIAENGIELSGGTTSWSYAQIGNGGYQSGGVTKSHQGDIYLNYNPDTGTATGGGEIVLSGRKGTNTGSLSATYAQIGHGGRNAAGTKRGDIVIGQSDAITLTGFGGESYAQIGHGGNGSGPNYAASGSIELNTSGLLQMNSGFGAEAYTLVGHGGYTSTAAGTTANYGLAGESIAVHARAVEMMAGSALGAFSQIGHGGYRISGTKTADISVETLDGISLRAGSGTGEAAYAQIGHGGYQSGGTLSGDVSALASSATSTVVLQAGDGQHQYAQIGHGGTSAAGSRSGDIEVAALAGIELHGGSGNETTARIGHGGTGASGAADGAVRVASAAHLLLASGDGNGGSAQIGHGGRLSSGVTSGIIEVAAVQDIDLLGGNGLFSTTQIGHGGFGFGGSVTDQSIAVATAGALTLLGGAANVQIGHGGFNAQSIHLSGDIVVDALGDLTITGGTGAFASAQIGNLARSSFSEMGGDITVFSGGSIALTALNGADAAYAKIGHGHDFQPSLAALSPVAAIAGDILVGAYANISLHDAMIGHLNAASSATVSAGETQIGVSLADPTDPAGGTLLADAQSEFHGADGLRFYLPQRSNNQIAAGAMLNGATFPGAAPDPFDHQRDDEYTRNILGDLLLTPNEHDNLFGTGPAPGNAAGYAFYYDTITLVAGAGLPPADPGTGASPPTPAPPSVPIPTNPLLQLLGLLPGDRILDDWLKDREEEFSGYGEFQILYENFEHYDLIGVSTFRFDGFPSGGESGLGEP